MFQRNHDMFLVIRRRFLGSRCNRLTISQNKLFIEKKGYGRTWLKKQQRFKKLRTTFEIETLSDFKVFKF